MGRSQCHIGYCFTRHHREPAGSGPSRLLLLATRVTVEVARIILSTFDFYMKKILKILQIVQRLLSTV